MFWSRLMSARTNYLRWCSVFCCLVGAAVTLFAQQRPNSSEPPIEILKLKWEKQVRLPRNFDPSIVSTNGSFGDARNPLSPTTAAGNPVNPADVTRAATKARSEAAGAETVFPETPGRLPVFYLYSMKIRNTGVKTIEGVAWNYLFFDGGGSKPLGGHQFLSYQKLAPGKISTFQRAMRSPPIRVIQAAAQNSTRPKVTE